MDDEARITWSGFPGVGRWEKKPDGCLVHTKTFFGTNDDGGAVVRDTVEDYSIDPNNPENSQEFWIQHMQAKDWVSEKDLEWIAKNWAPK